MPAQVRAAWCRIKYFKSGLVSPILPIKVMVLPSGDAETQFLINWSAFKGKIIPGAAMFMRSIFAIGPADTILDRLEIVINKSLVNKACVVAINYYDRKIRNVTSVQK